MFENSMWLSAMAKEEIQNNSICIYNSHDQSLRNIRNRDEIATNIFVFVDTEGSFYDFQYVPKTTIKKGEYARCLRINITV